MAGPTQEVLAFAAVHDLAAGLHGAAAAVADALFRSLERPQRVPGAAGGRLAERQAQVLGLRAHLVDLARVAAHAVSLNQAVLRLHLQAGVPLVPLLDQAAAHDGGDVERPPLLDDIDAQVHALLCLELDRILGLPRRRPRAAEAAGEDDGDPKAPGIDDRGGRSLAQVRGSVTGSHHDEHAAAPQEAGPRQWQRPDQAGDHGAGERRRVLVRIDRVQLLGLQIGGVALEVRVPAPLHALRPVGVLHWHANGAARDVEVGHATPGDHGPAEEQKRERQEDHGQRAQQHGEEPPTQSPRFRASPDALQHLRCTRMVVRLLGGGGLGVIQ
mmetsp:Transcript_18529/g.47634  ORF Transcript_18529/g.47634 Transcript_18529/m.47634 type:complete len:328 (-) Transcript_18529:1401-2384(-)